MQYKYIPKEKIPLLRPGNYLLSRKYLHNSWTGLESVELVSYQGELIYDHNFSNIVINTSWQGWEARYVTRPNYGPEHLVISEYSKKWILRYIV